MIVAVLLDHVGVLVAQQHAFNVWRLLGVLHIVVGVVIVQRF